VYAFAGITPTEVLYIKPPAPPPPPPPEPPPAPPATTNKDTEVVAVLPYVAHCVPVQYSHNPRVELNPCCPTFGELGLVAVVQFVKVGEMPVASCVVPTVPALGAIVLVCKLVYSTQILFVPLGGADVKVNVEPDTE
jgi:hypothetical protein